MLAHYRKSEIAQWLVVVTIAGFVNLIMPRALLAGPSFAPLEESGASGSEVSAGLVLRGDLDLSNFSLGSFVARSVDGSGSGPAGLSNDLHALDNERIEMYLPLVTLGDNVRQPGILYNQQSGLFGKHVARAVGEEAGGAAGEAKETGEAAGESQTVLWPYLLGVALVAGGVVLAVGSSSGGDNDNTGTHQDSDDDDD